MSTPQSQLKHDYSGIVEMPSPQHEAMHNYDGIVEPSHNYDGIVELPKASVKFDENADFSGEVGPVKDYKPMEFEPESPSLMQRAAMGGQALAGVAQLPKGHSDTWGAQRIAVLQSPGQPTQDQLADAMLEAIGPQASEIGRRYRNETGRSIIEPDVGADKIRAYYDDASKSYKIPFNPTIKVIRTLNGYAKGGLSGVSDELAQMEMEDRKLAAQQDVDKRKIEDSMPSVVSAVVNPSMRRGIASASLGSARLVNNLSGLVRDPNAAAEDALALQGAQASIPKETTLSGKIIRGVTEAGMTAPRYALEGMISPALPALDSYSSNLDRGPQAAIVEAEKIAATAGASSGIGGALEGAAPLTRQAVARGTGAATNAGLAYAGGERDPGNLAAAGIVGGAMPIGKGGGEREGFAPTRPLAEAPLTRSMTGEQFTHPTLGDLTATADQTGLRSGWVRVVDESSGAPFVVRRPNAQGRGDVRYANDSGDVDAASAPGLRTPTEKVSNVLNVARGLQTSFDTHSLFRQAAVSFGSNPVRTLKAYFKSIPSLWSEDYAGRMMNDIQASSHAQLAKDSGLYLADNTSSQPLTRREENFLSNVVGKIPVVRGTQRQFHVFLDKVRMDAFSAYAETNPDASPETLNDVSKFINYSTGRGNLGRFGERHALGLSNVFYSPRFTVSRLQTALSPLTSSTPQGKMYAATQLARYVATNVGLMGIAKAAGLDVGVNPLSNDFGTVKVGNTRVNLWGGMNTTARYVGQLMMGESASADTGNAREKSRLKTALTFIRTKLAPQSSVLVDSATGTDFKGQPATAGSMLRRSFTPISWNDIYDAVKEDQRQGGSGLKGALTGATGLFGAGVQTIASEPQDDRLNEYVKRLKTQPESRGLDDSQLKVNARVNLEMNRLLDSVSDEKKEAARRFLNSYFYDGRVRPEDRRPVSAVEKVLDSRLVNVGAVLKGHGF